MAFSGRIYYELTSPDVWRLYRLMAAAAAQGVQLAVEWRPFVAGERMGDVGRPHCAVAWAADLAPDRYGDLLQALLGLTHDGGEDPSREEVLGRAAALAGLDGEAAVAAADDPRWRDAVEASRREARDLGVVAVPSIYRHGPVLYIRTTPAAAVGDATRRLAVIDAMLEDDGLWELRKP